MTSKTTLALKLYYGATEKHIKAFWSMKERDMGIEGKMFGTTECRLMCEMGIPAYSESLITWEKVLDYLRPLGDKMYRIHKARKVYWSFFDNLPHLKF